jgi:hypothetical protein
MPTLKARKCCRPKFGPVQQEIFPRMVRGKILQMTQLRNYGEGEELGEEPVLIVVFVSVLVDAAGDSDSFTMVVLDSVFSAGGLVTVVSFCSHATSSAAPARMQIYFFICAI